MRRVAAAVLAATALLAFTAVPAQAQDNLLDLPRLGFSVDPNEGFPGDHVDGIVDTDDVQEHCLGWLPPEADPALYLGGIWTEYATIVISGWEGEGPFFFGADMFETDFEGNDIEDPVFQAFYRVYLSFATALIFQVPGINELFFASMFPMTFVDPVTQELLGDLGGYDPFTGEGAIVVPDLPPALYVIAAACTFPRTAEEQVLGGSLDRSFAAFAEWASTNYPDDEFPAFDLFGPGAEAWAEFVEEAAQLMLIELVDIQAIGLDFYCILDDNDLCGPPPPDAASFIAGVEARQDPVEQLDMAAADESELEERVGAPDAVGATPAFTG